MRKTFNYTDRKRLLYKGKKPDFKIKLNDEENYSSSYILKLINFEKFKSFGDNSFITLDCFDSNFFEHKNFGSISSIKDKELETVSVLAQAASLRFHLKVIDEKKQILAMSKNINPNTTFMLFSVIAKDMKDIWITDVEEGLPLIYVNKELKIKQRLYRYEPKLLLTILPAAFRDFLKKFIVSGQVKEESEYAMAWIKYAEKFTEGESLPHKENLLEVEKWIEKFSENHTYEIFEKKYKIKQKYKEEEDKQD